MFNVKTRDEAWTAWLAELRRSGAKKKMGMLEDAENPGARCCLGHLCHAIGVGRVLRQSAASIGVVYCYYDDNDVMLSDNIASFMNLTPLVSFREPIKIKMSNCMTASDINDYTDFTLAEIADILERERDRGNLLSFDEWEDCPANPA